MPEDARRAGSPFTRDPGRRTGKAALPAREWVRSQLGGLLAVASALALVGVVGTFGTSHFDESHLAALVVFSGVLGLGAGLFRHPHWPWAGYLIGGGAWILVLASIVVTAFRRSAGLPVPFPVANVALELASMLATPFVLVASLAAVYGTRSATLRRSTWVALVTWSVAAVLHASSPTTAFVAPRTPRLVAFAVVGVAAALSTVERLAAHRPMLGATTFAALLVAECIRGVEAFDPRPSRYDDLLSAALYACAQVSLALPITLLIAPANERPLTRPSGPRVAPHAGVPSPIAEVLAVAGIGTVCALLVLGRHAQHPFVSILEQTTVATLGAVLFYFGQAIPAVRTAIRTLAWVPLVAALVVGAADAHVAAGPFDTGRFLGVTSWLATPIVLASALAAMGGAAPTTLRRSTFAAALAWTAAIVCLPGVLDGRPPDASLAFVRTLAFGFAAVAATFMAMEHVGTHRRVLGRVTLGVVGACELVRWIEAASAWPRSTNLYAGGAIVLGFQIVLALPLTVSSQDHDRT